MLSECAILLFALSHHVGASVDYNETHPMLGVECEDWSAGAYINSEVNLYYDGHEIVSTPAERVSLWVSKRWSGEIFYGELGVVTGYRESALLPVIRGGIDFGNIELFAAPGYDSYADSPMLVTGVQFKLEI